MERWRGYSVILAIASFAALFAVLPSTGAGTEVRMEDFRFRPAAVEIPVGDAITFDNQSGSTHTAGCDGCPFDTGDVRPGLQRTVTFAKPGRFAIVCRYHGGRGMTGVITVQG